MYQWKRNLQHHLQETWVKASPRRRTAVLGTFSGNPISTLPNGHDSARCAMITENLSLRKPLQKLQKLQIEKTKTMKLHRTIWKNHRCGKQCNANTPVKPDEHRYI
jgi:hypothetical protein